MERAGVRGCAVLLPGRAYDLPAPLLARARDVLVADGWEVRPVAWDAPAPVPGSVQPADAEEFVVRHLRHVPADLGAAGGDVLVVAKSLGARAAAYAATRAWSAVWLTPLLRDTSCQGGIATNPASQLLVGGTADPYWDPAGAVSLGRTARVEVLEIPDADHGMTVPGDDAATAAALDRVGDAVAGLARRVRGSHETPRRVGRRRPAGRRRARPRPRPNAELTPPDGRGDGDGRSR